uniref:Uncharacterized protein n=1 Tax=Anopheles merus TaxID=30066 RepID=A0A182V457_ANOME
MAGEGTVQLDRLASNSRNGSNGTYVGWSCEEKRMASGPALTVNVQASLVRSGAHAVGRDAGVQPAVVAVHVADVEVRRYVTVDVEKLIHRVTVQRRDVEDGLVVEQPDKLRLMLVDEAKW